MKLKSDKGPFKYYVIIELGGWVQKSTKTCLRNIIGEF
jgi:hypothetical protein